MKDFSIDINCDLGESTEREGLAREAEIMPLVSSCNIACGFHAGNSDVMNLTVGLALEHGVAIGAHPGYDDAEGFGRRAIELSNDEMADLILEQIEALGTLVSAKGGELKHVKLHGALYNLLSVDYEKALVAAEAVKSFGTSLKWYALSGSESDRAGRDVGLTVVREAFIDRAYLPSGQLMPRSSRGAVLTDVEMMAERAIRLVISQEIIDQDGTLIEVPNETLCIHGDHPGATQTAQLVRTRMKEAGIDIRSAS